MRSACPLRAGGVLLAVVLHGCATAAPQAAPSRTTPVEDAPEAPQEVLPEPTAPLLIGPELRFDGTTSRRGTGFFVRHGDASYVVTSAGLFEPSDPPLLAIDLIDTRAPGGAVARVEASWGLPGDAGADLPVLDLRSDRLVGRLEAAPGEHAHLPLDPRPMAAIGERVWLALAEAGAPMGYVQLPGTITDADVAFVEVRLDEPRELPSPGGGPVVSLSDGVVVGMMSRVAQLQGNTVLWLTPASAVQRAVEAGAHAYPLRDVLPGGQSAAAGPTHLRFAWPAAVDARVSRERLRRGPDGEERSEASFSMRVEQDPEGYLISYHDFALSDGAGERRAEELSRIANLGPSYRVSTAGEFGAVVDLDRLLAALDSLLVDLPEEQRALMRQRFVNPDVLAQLAIGDWTQRVANWIDAELDAGDTYQLDAEVEMPMFGQGTVATRSYFQLTKGVPCDETDLARRCVRLDMLTMPDRARMQALMQRFLGGMAPPELRGRLPELRAFRLRSRLQLVTEPATLLPHRVREEKVTSFSVEGVQRSVESYELKQDRYRYVKPADE